MTMRIHAYIIYYNKIIKSNHLPAMYKQPIILYNYTIFYAFCLESVYKLFRKNTLNKPAAGGTMQPERNEALKKNKKTEEKKENEKHTYSRKNHGRNYRIL